MSTPLRTPKTNKYCDCYRTIYIYTCDSIGIVELLYQPNEHQKAECAPCINVRTFVCMLRIFVNVNILFFILAQKTHWLYWKSYRNISVGAQNMGECVCVGVLCAVCTRVFGISSTQIWNNTTISIVTIWYFGSFLRHSSSSSVCIIIFRYLYSYGSLCMCCVYSIRSHHMKDTVTLWAPCWLLIMISDFCATIGLLWNAAPLCHSIRIFAVLSVAAARITTSLSFFHKHIDFSAAQTHKHPPWCHILDKG